MKNPLFALLLLVESVSSNPIVGNVTDYVGTKTWERCVCSVGTSSTTVSCALGYKLSRFDDSVRYLSLAVPVFSEIGGDTEPPYVEIDGKRVESEVTVNEATREFRNSWKIKKSIPLVLYRFHILLGGKKDFTSLVITYSQENVKGEFIYLPLFEGGETPKSEQGFSMTLIPAEPSVRLDLTSKHKSVQYDGSSRVTLSLEHQKAVRVATSKG